LACIAIYTKFRLKAAGGGCNLEIEKERERERERWWFEFGCFGLL
jgi:hypothetical protein